MFAKIGDHENPGVVIFITLHPVVTSYNSIETYFAAATSQNTRRAYQADIRHFDDLGRFIQLTPICYIFRSLGSKEQLNSKGSLP
jgi:hypothetical protein